MKLLQNSLLVVIVAASSGCASSIDSVNDKKLCNDAGSEYYCLMDEVCCMGQCVKLSDENCGSCGNVCSEFQTCEKQLNGLYECVCTNNHLPCSLTCCTEGCVELSTNTENCGVCGRTCVEGQRCYQGQCQCMNGQVLCGSSCVDINANVNHCGGCHQTCPDSSQPNLHIIESHCSKGHCMMTCADGYQNLDGNMDNGCEVFSYKCGNDIVDPNEVCDGINLNGKDCRDILGAGFHGVPTCATDCQSFVTTSCTRTNTDETGRANCGNGILETGETCDKSDIGDMTCDQFMGKGSVGVPECSSDCRAFLRGTCTDPSQSPFCGDNIKNNDEECDNKDLGNATCETLLGKGATGTPACSTNCKLIEGTCKQSDCAEGAYQCIQNSLQTCRNSHWVETALCTGNTPLCSDSLMKCVGCFNHADCGSNAKCNPDTNQCEAISPEYTAILEITDNLPLPDENTNPAVIGKFNTVATTQNGINIGHWPTTSTPDFNSKYIKISLSTTDLAKLAGKSKAAVSFSYNQNGKGPKKVAVAWYDGSTQLGFCDNYENNTTGTMLSNVERCELSLSHVSDLHVRIVGYDTPTANAGTLRIFPVIRIEAK